MKHLLILSLFAATFLHCDTTSSGNNNSSTITASVDNEFELKFSNTARLDSAGITITFADVSEDSRCPSGVECVWSGNAEILLNVNDNSRSLNTHTPPRQVSVGDYSIQLILLTPYPQEGSSIEKEDYTVTLLVTENSTFGN